MLPDTVKSPVTVRLPPIVTSSGNPTVTFPAEADTLTSFAVPVKLNTPVLVIVSEDPSPPLPPTVIPLPAVAPAT